MGAEEVRSPARRLAVVIAACLLVALAGCGEEDPQANVSEAETRGPSSAEGDIVPTPATLRSGEGYTTLVSTQITTRGAEDTLVAGQAALRGGTRPELRLKVDGKVERDAVVETTGSGDARSAVVSCACELPTGEHTIVLEGTASSGTATVGARTLLVFPEVGLDGGTTPVAESALVSELATVDAEGTTLAETPASDGSGPAIVIASIRGPHSGPGNDNVRLAVSIGGDVANELAVTTIPSGKIVAYLDENGAGEEVVARGYTTAGEVPVQIASIIVCDCGLRR